MATIVSKKKIKGSTLTFQVVGDDTIANATTKQRRERTTIVRVPLEWRKAILYVKSRVRCEIEIKKKRVRTLQKIHYYSGRRIGRGRSD